MSTVLFNPGQHRVDDHAEPQVQTVDLDRGTWGILLFIMTEAMLFVMLFVAYFYITKIHDWTMEDPPKLHYSLPMLAILLTSSVVLHWGEQQVKKRRIGAGRAALVVTVLLGLVFLFLTYLEDIEHLKTLTPRSNAYGSIFYTIVSLHGVHVVVGLLMLCWVLFLRRWEPAQYSPHRPYHNAAMYWHFVDTVWVFVVVILYVIPNLRNVV
jgi:cytochrome c oxidase subunit 3/cytochrome c oxidase subunit I+III